ncbi:MAG: ribosome maturation factor RimP [Acidobacteria bacterium]|nr:ribosome maturation factor RimP [Acidobacteriota bacterium]
MVHNERESLVGSITALAEQVAASMGMEVVLVEIKGGGRSVVRVYIDQAGGVSVDDCERFSKRFSVLLDVEDCVPFSYVLEVSSPGLDRPLVREADFQRFTGKQVKVRTGQPLQGQRNFRGRILGASGGNIRLELSPGQQVEMALSQIERANLVVEIQATRNGSLR